MNREIYQDIVLDHFRNPRCKHDLSDANSTVITIRNPNCGDLVVLEATTDAAEGGDETTGLLWRHNAQGCAASVASTSILCDKLTGVGLEQARETVCRFLDALESEISLEDASGGDLELEALLYFRNVPARKLCVSLAWTAAKNALAALSA